MEESYGLTTVRGMKGPGSISLTSFSAHRSSTRFRPCRGRQRRSRRRDLKRRHPCDVHPIRGGEKPTAGTIAPRTDDRKQGCRLSRPRHP